MPTITQVRNAVDARLVTLWSIVQTRQDAYFLAHGKFFQGRRTHTSEPANTGAGALQTAAGDLLSGHPTDQPETWLDFLPELDGLAVEMVLTIDVYNGPAGWGFVGTVRVTHNSTTYERAANHGPESWRAFAWRVAV